MALYINRIAPVFAALMLLAFSGCAEQTAEIEAEQDPLSEEYVRPSEVNSDEPQVTIAPFAGGGQFSGRGRKIDGQQILATLDGNGDGVLTGDEIFEHYRPADADDDGQITAQELEDWHANDLKANAAKTQDGEL